MYGAMTRALERWHSVRVTHLKRLQMDALKKEFDRGEYRERTDPVPEAQTGAQPRKLSSKVRNCLNSAICPIEGWSMTSHSFGIVQRSWHTFLRQPKFPQTPSAASNLPWHPHETSA